jgi:hypothetical protein
MASNLPIRTFFLLTLVLLAFLVPSPATTSVSADCEEELAAVKEQLNATNKQLVVVENERDDYAQRLEDSTTIIIITLGLLIISWLVFWVSSRRQQVVLMELQRRTGVTLDSPTSKERKRRRG